MYKYKMGTMNNSRLCEERIAVIDIQEIEAEDKFEAFKIYNKSDDYNDSEDYVVILDTNDDRVISVYKEGGLEIPNYKSSYVKMIYKSYQLCLNNIPLRYLYMDDIISSSLKEDSIDIPKYEEHYPSSTVCFNVTYIKDVMMDSFINKLQNDGADSIAILLSISNGLRQYVLARMRNMLFEDDSITSEEKDNAFEHYAKNLYIEIADMKMDKGYILLNIKIGDGILPEVPSFIEDYIEKICEVAE